MLLFSLNINAKQVSYQTKTDSSLTSKSEQLSEVIVKTKAKKLPDIQLVSSWMPESLRQDSMAVQPNNSFKAYNSGTQIYYALANDSQKLYLRLKVTDTRTIYKIIEGGVSFVLTSEGKKPNNEPITLLFPLLSISDAQVILRKAGKIIDERPLNSNISRSQLRDAYLSNLTFSLKDANALLNTKLKEIKISGVNTITDTIPTITPSNYYQNYPLRKHAFKIINVKNSDDITANLHFDQKANLYYNIELPLSYLLPKLENGRVISYRLELNGRGEDSRVADVKYYQSNGTLFNEDIETTTELHGEYTLAKAP